MHCLVKNILILAMVFMCTSDQDLHNFFICSFLRQCGMRLITLRLGCCQYISRETLKTIVKECPVLEGMCKCVFYTI